MSIYTVTARFDAGGALTGTEIRRIAPSIFAVTAHVLRGIIREGFNAGRSEAVAAAPKARSTSRSI